MAGACIGALFFGQLTDRFGRKKLFAATVLTAFAGTELSEPDTSITVRQRRTIPFRTIAATAFTVYPKRTVLGLALFVGWRRSSSRPPGRAPPT